MPSDDSQGKYFCFFTVNNPTQLITSSVLLGLSLLIIADAFRKYLRVGGQHNNNVSFVYRMILAWWLTYIASGLFGIILFSLHDNSPQDYSDDYLSQTTKYSFVVNWVNAFLIQWILIYVPYHWAKKITDLFCYLNQRGNQLQEAEKSQYRGYETRIYPALKLYMKVRMCFVLQPILFLALSSLTAHQVLFKLMVASLLLDCIVIIVSLVFGMISLKTTEQLKLQLDETQSKRMANQYLMIILASILRFGFDITYVISKVFGDESFSSICPDLADSSSASELTFIICECIFTHYLPIFIILRIYNLEERPEEIAKSLLITTESEGSFGM